VVRQKVVYDGALPSGNSVSLLNLARLARITASPEVEEMAYHLARTFTGAVAASPATHSLFLCGLGFLLGPTREIVVTGHGKEADALLEAVREKFLPDKALIFKDSGLQDSILANIAPYTKDMQAPPGKAKAYVCEDFHCVAPVETRSELLQLLQDAKS
jgi:uncharacterized protein YyaL (SSP411 family)